MKKLSSINKKIVIAGDPHQNLGWFNTIIEKEEPFDYFINLGDHFDTPKTPDGVIIYGISQTCVWINENLENEKFVWLAANHDVAYQASYIPNSYNIRKNTWYNCSGWTKSKASSINKSLNPDFFKKQELCCQVDDYVVSHAGFHSAHFKPYHSEQENIELLYNKWQQEKNSFYNSPFHWIWDVGVCRGGDSKVGSPIWLDWAEEFYPLDNTKQIVGHSTNNIGIREKNNNYCIDGMQNTYCVIKDRKLIFKNVRNQKEYADFSNI